jgi:hypothetical protein
MGAVPVNPPVAPDPNTVRLSMAAIAADRIRPIEEIVEEKTKEVRRLQRAPLPSELRHAIEKR